MIITFLPIHYVCIFTSLLLILLNKSVSSNFNSSKLSHFETGESGEGNCIKEIDTWSQCSRDVTIYQDIPISWYIKPVIQYQYKLSCIQCHDILIFWPYYCKLCVLYYDWCCSVAHISPLQFCNRLTLKSANFYNIESTLIFKVKYACYARITDFGLIA